MRPHGFAGHRVFAKQRGTDRQRHPKRIPLRVLLQANADTRIDDIPQPRGRRILLWVGPEGGFDNGEAATAIAKGFRGLRLGPRVLRTETAGLVGLSLLQARFGDLG